MSELQLIQDVLLQTERRRRMQRALRGLWQGLLIGASIWCLTVAAHKLFPTPAWTLSAAAAFGVAAACIGLIVGGWRRHSVNETARWVDGRTHLQERLSTALEFARTDSGETWSDLVLADAASHLKDFDPRRLVGFRLSRASRWALLLIALGIGLGFVPEYRTKAYVKKQNEQQAIKEAGKQLVELTKHNLTNRPPALEHTEQAMEAVNDLGQKLTKNTMTRDQALKDIAKMSERLKEDIKNFAKDPALRQMAQAARSDTGNSPNDDQLQRQIDEAQKKMGDNTATPEQMDKMNTDLAKLEAAAKAEMDKNGELSQSTKENLAQSLAAMSKQANSLGMNMPNLDQAIQALAASQTGMFVKDLQNSENDLQKLNDLAKSIQQMQQQQGDKLGKDLAEQLQNGQPQAAQNTLQKMIDKLNSGALTPDQANQMMSEVSKAADPGSKYGKAGDYLKQAASQMGQGQKSDAAQSLASASKELDKVMQQMGDAQSLMSEMSALDKAAMGVGDGDKWSLSDGEGQGNGKGQSKRIGFGRNNEPGRGVGTWADENSGWGYNGQQSGLWDNSGVNRPDQKSKGISDRDTDLSPALEPSQVRGHFAPGGEMPSITLKGVSIKGASQVSYTQAVEAAQNDAASAVSQDKVPRAYRDTVHDYFDDLKQ